MTLKSLEILKSTIDNSINFVEQQLTGFIESRYVRRVPEYFIAYLSSQTGCNRGCKMCHLTTSHQTQFTNCDLQDFSSQLSSILSHYSTESSAKYVHINFMARGEMLANPTIINNSTELFYKLGQQCQEYSLPVKFNASTIIPKTLRKSLIECFPIITPTIYYSIYSIEDNFRSKWLPGAMDVNDSLKLLSDYQRFSKKVIKFHNAFIENENDNETSIINMMKLIKSYNIHGEFNIVRYNPFSESQGVESSKLPAINKIINNFMPCKIITKVGEDVKASCGTFI